MSATEETPRRPTPTERLHAALMAAIDRKPAAAVLPSFDVQRTKAGAEQAKATGVYEFVEWSVHVPVCDEFPTSDEAHAAMLRYAKLNEETWPASNGVPPSAEDVARGQQQRAAIAAKKRAKP